MGRNPTFGAVDKPVPLLGTPRRCITHTHPGRPVWRERVADIERDVSARRRPVPRATETIVWSRKLKLCVTCLTLWCLCLGSIAGEVKAPLLTPEEKHALLSDREFLLISGWVTGKWNRNLQNARSMDDREFESLEKTLEAHLDHLASDPEYPCRRPLMFEYLSGKLGLNKQPTCSFATRILPEASAEVFDLNPDNISAADFVFTAGSTSDRKHMGHVELRLVFCRGAIDEAECRVDPRRSVLLSYDAGSSIYVLSAWSAWRFVTNGYRGEFGLFTTDEMLREYTTLQFRPLFEVNLDLAQHELRRIALKALEDYWTHRGVFRFASNSCVTALADFLMIARPDVRITRRLALTPRMLARMLEKQRLTDVNLTRASNWDEYAKNRQIGSFDSEPTRSYEYLVSLSPRLRKVPLEVLANRWSPEKRDQLRIELIQDNPTLEANVLSAFRSIESHSLKLYEELREKFFMDLVNNGDLMGIFKYRAVKQNPLFIELLSHAQALQSQLQPWNQPSRGYGIALLDDFDGGEKKYSAVLSQFQGTLNALESFYGVMCPKEAIKIDQGRRNLEQWTEMYEDIYAQKAAPDSIGLERNEGTIRGARSPHRALRRARG